MSKEFLQDKFAGALLGLAVGDALGGPVEGMTAFDVMLKFHTPVDMFYPRGISKPGEYSSEALCTLLLLETFKKHGGEINETSVAEAQAKLTERCPYPPISPIARMIFSRVVPAALRIAATGQEAQELSGLTKLINKAIPLKRPDNLAVFIFAEMLRQLIRYSEDLKKPYELYDSDKSLLARLTEMARNTENNKGEDFAEDRLSDRLITVRRKLMHADKWDILRFEGLMGNSDKINVCLSNALFCYFSAPDDFSTISKIVTMGGPASTTGAMVGTLIGATIGASLMPRDMKDQVKNGINIETMGFDFAECCLCKTTEPIKDTENVD